MYSNVFCNAINLFYTFVAYIAIHVDAADAGAIEVTRGCYPGGDDLAQLLRRVVVDLHGIQAQAEEYLGKCLAQQRNIATPTQVEELQVWRLGELGSMTMRVTSAVVDAVGLVFGAPCEVYREQQLLVILLRNHRVAALGVDVERLVHEAGDAVDRDG